MNTERSLLSSMARMLATAASVVAVIGLAPAIALAAAGDLATSAWQCGPEGRTYTDAPCAGGREIALPAPRPVADVQAAQRVAARERARADRLRLEREAREAAAIAASSQPANLGPRRARAVSEKGPRAGARPTKRAQPTTTTAQRPKLQRPQPAPSPDAGDGTWRAVAPASPRAAG